MEQACQGGAFSVALQVFSVCSEFRFSNLNTENTEKGEELEEAFPMLRQFRSRTAMAAGEAPKPSIRAMPGV
jgi:hypothetical protein